MTEPSADSDGPVAFAVPSEMRCICDPSAFTAQTWDSATPQSPTAVVQREGDPGPVAADHSLERNGRHRAQVGHLLRSGAIQIHR